MEYMSNDIGELAAALAAAQGEFTFAAKGSEASMGGAGKRKYADLQSVLEAVRDGLAKNGLAVVQSPMPAENGIRLRTLLAHKSGQWIASELCLPQDKMGGVQGMGSALTYARRYALAAMVGIAQDDDDGAQAMREGKACAREQAKAANPSPMPDGLRKRLFATLRERGFATPEAMKGELGSFFGREIITTNSLTAEEVREYLDTVYQGKNDA